MKNESSNKVNARNVKRGMKKKKNKIKKTS